MLVLSSVMMLCGGYALVSGLLKLRDPTVVLSVGITEAAGSEAEVRLSRELEHTRLTVVEPHRTRVQTEAVIEILLALFTLYATAAVLARDRNGRALALGVATLGIVYQLGTLPVYLSLMHDYAAHASDLLAEVAVQSAGASSALSAPEVSRRLRSAMIGGPIVVAVAGVVGCLVLAAYFGGRRGRALYGMDLPVVKKTTEG